MQRRHRQQLYRRLNRPRRHRRRGTRAPTPRTAAIRRLPRLSQQRRLLQQPARATRGARRTAAPLAQGEVRANPVRRVIGRRSRKGARCRALPIPAGPPRGSPAARTPSAPRAAAARSPSAAASAPATVVKYGTRHSSALRRIENESSVSARSPSGVLITMAIVAAADRVDDSAGCPRATLLIALDARARAREVTRPCRASRRARSRRAQALRAIGSTRRLVLVAHADEDRAAAPASTVPARDLRLGERRAEVVVDPHHLAGRPHLGPEHRVDAGELGEREDRLLDRDVRAARSPR